MPLALAFSLILTVALRVLHSYSTDDKTSRLMVKKILHSEQHPERFTKLHGEEKREKGPIDLEKKYKLKQELSETELTPHCPQKLQRNS